MRVPESRGGGAVAVCFVRAIRMQFRGAKRVPAASTESPPRILRSMSTPLTHAELSHALADLGYRDVPAAFHGALSGVLCRQKPEEVDLVALLEEEGLQVDDDGLASLQRLRDGVLAALTDLQVGFTPLLPDDDAPLETRAHALGAWCEGFLFGLAGRNKLEIRDCSEEVREILKDLTQFTRASLDSSGDLEVEEGAYAELVEYIRVGAQLVYMELHPRPDAPGASPTLH